MSEETETTFSSEENVDVTKENQDYEKKKAAIEAILFATNGMTVDEIVKRTVFEKKEIQKILEELEMEYLHHAKGVQIIKEGDIWKMSVKPEHTPDVKDLLPPEMPKGLIKTLAIIAAKKPIKQSTIIKIRGNKAYGHIKKLERIGFITTERHGNTQILDLTEKFFDYFKVIEKELKKRIKPEEKELIEKIEAETGE